MADGARSAQLVQAGGGLSEHLENVQRDFTKYGRQPLSVPKCFRPAPNTTNKEVIRDSTT